MLPRLLPLVLSLCLPLSLHSAPVEVVPADFRGALQPQLAIAPNGRVHVVFGKENAIFHTSSEDGRAFSTPVKVGELEKLALRMRRGPRVAATNERVLVTAMSHADGYLHAWTSEDAGKTWKGSAPLNTVEKSAREGLHSIAGDGKGLVAAAWLDLRTGGMEVRGRVSRDGGATWGEDRSIYQSPDGHVCECCVANVAISPTGEIAVTWRNWIDGSRDLYLATSRDGGSTFSPAQKLGSGTWKLKGCPMDGGGIAFGPDGDWSAVWRREREVFASDAVTPEKLLAKEAVQPVVAFAGKTPLRLWEAGGTLMLQRGIDAPQRFAESAAAASLVSGSETAAIVWESMEGGEKTICFDRLR